MMYICIYIFLLSSPRARSLAPTPHTRRLANGIFCACTFILRHLSHALEIFAYEILAFAPERCFAANRTGQFNDPLTIYSTTLLAAALHPLSSGFVRGEKVQRRLTSHL